MYSAIADNKRKTWFMMVFFVALVAVIAWFVSEYLLGNPSFTIAIIIGGLVYALISYFGASRMAIAMSGAKEITEREEPRLWRTVENLSITEGMPMPKVYVVEDAGLNAFATGRDPEHAVVAATRGLLKTLDDSELEGVMAHELGHVKNYDIRVSMVAMALAMVIAVIADMAMRWMFWGGGSRRSNDRNNSNGLMMIIGIIGLVLAPIVAKLIQLAISRKREYLADATGAMTTRYPDALASALNKLKTHGSKLRKQNTAMAHMYIANPLSSKSIGKLFSTHPPIDERIKRLNEMGGKL